MPFLHFYNSFRISITYPKFTLLRIKWPLGRIKLLILFCLPFNTILAGEIFSTGFESGSIRKGEVLQNGFSWGDGTYTSVSSNNSKSGNYSLKFRFRAAGGGNPQGDDAWSEQRFNLGGFYPDIWIKYDLYIPANYTHKLSDTGKTAGTNNKGLRIWAGSYGTAETREGPKLGHNLMAHYKGNGNSYAFLQADAYWNGVSTYDNEWLSPDEKSGKTSSAITDNDLGHWMTIVHHYKYASSANNDGIAEVWKTDWQGKTEKMIDVSNGAWYGSQPSSTLPARGFTTGYLLGWANSGFIEETILYIDNITFSTSPLINEYVTNYLAPPMPPIILFD